MQTMVDFLTLFKIFINRAALFLGSRLGQFWLQPKESLRERLVFAAHARVRLAFLLRLKLSHPRRCETPVQSEIPFDDGV